MISISLLVSSIITYYFHWGISLNPIEIFFYIFPPTASFISLFCAYTKAMMETPFHATITQYIYNRDLTPCFFTTYGNSKAQNYP